MIFDSQTALHCARLVSDLYDGRLAPTFAQHSTDTQVLVQRFESSTYVIWPGTASLTDWLTDVRIRKVEWFDGSCGRVHAGFRDAFLSIAGCVRDELELHKACNVVVAGHSLGGALAMLCAHYLQHCSRVKPTEVYTFGQPRVGNWIFASDYNANLHDNTWRIVNQRDPVPAVPFVFGSYKHCGTEVYLKDGGGTTIAHPMWTAVVEAGKAIADKVGESAGPIAAEHAAFVSVSAHKIPAYIAKLEALKE